MEYRYNGGPQYGDPFNMPMQEPVMHYEPVQEYHRPAEVETQVQYVPPVPPVQEAPKADDPGHVIYKLKKPIEFEGVHYSELDMNFNDLTGADVEMAINNAGPSQSMLMEMDKKYCAALAARAAKVPYELFKYLNIRDYTDITIFAQTFIMGL